MKYLVILLSILLLSSCGKVPQDSYERAELCIDSLRAAGAENTMAFLNLQLSMKKNVAEMEKQKAMLFKKFGFVKYTFDSITNAARHFIMTDDIEDERPEYRSNLKAENMNSIRLVLEIDFSTTLSKEDALKIAADIDEAVRRNIIGAKLIRVKIVE